MKCVLPKEAKGIGSKIKNWIVFKRCLGRPLQYAKILDFLDKDFNINPQTQEKFAEIVQRIYNTIFVSFCKVSLKRSNYPGENSHWIKDLKDEKHLSTYYCNMKKNPLGPKKVKLSNHNDGIYGYGEKGKKEDKAYDITKQVEKANNNEKEKRSK